MFIHFIRSFFTLSFLRPQSASSSSPFFPLILFLVAFVPLPFLFTFLVQFSSPIFFALNIYPTFFDFQFLFLTSDLCLKILMSAKRVTIIGSGNWGSAIARIVGSTVRTHNTDFHETVKMWVFEELVDGRKLSEIINEQHENVKYLPGKKLPTNVVAVTDVVEAAKDADVLVFVIPHQHVHRVCGQLKGNIKTSAIAISLIKGLATFHEGNVGLRLISEEISKSLGISTAVLMGANLANEVAEDHFCEATIGTKNAERGVELKKLFQTDNFRINVVEDAETVELCGALKNIVACGAGFSAGLGYGDNTMAAIVRLGLMDMIRFIELFYPGANKMTFFESCGFADLLTTCAGGRNRKVCEAFVKSDKPLAEVEKQLLNGQSAQGPLTAMEVFEVLKAKDLTKDFAFFVAVHKICSGETPANRFLDLIRR